jgi:large subunit ribosomal protein L3
MVGLIAKKVGMTQIFDEAGVLVPVTVIRVEKNAIVGRRTVEKNGYEAVVLGCFDAKKSRVSKPAAGQFAEGLAPKKTVRELRDFSPEGAIGDSVGVEAFEGCAYVDVTATSKGKGFQGVVRRYGFHGGRATHGSKFHREPGSTGQCSYPSHTFKNVKMPGRMGRETVTVQNLSVVKVDKDNGMLLVRGAVPGYNDCLLIVREAVKKAR